MMFNEDAYLTSHAGNLPKGAWLVLAPHADDETFGMGGAIAKAVQEGGQVDVVVMTDGMLGGSEPNLKEIREAEARNAIRILGCRSVTFLRQADRGLRPSKNLIERIRDQIMQGAYCAVFFPSPVEPHPDHRTAAQIGWEALRKSGFPCEAISYEISTQGPCNILVDISSVADKKRRAMHAYASQITQSAYIERILGLNKSRTWSLPNEVAYAEAFQRWGKLDAPLAAQLSRIQRAQQSTDAIPETEELVSIIIRTVNRPHMLCEAIRSVANQTYTTIELVVVNDGDSDLAALVHEEASQSIVQYKYVKAGSPHGRARAANIGLSNATGLYAGFLDDDDLLFPSHVSTLVESLRTNVGSIAAYGSIICEDADGKNIHRFGSVFDHSRLFLGNYIPIHAVLFRRMVINKEVKFDEELEYCEDWDFWLQLARHGSFTFCSVDVGVYRIHPGQGLGIAHSVDALRSTELPVYRKWSPKWTDDHLYFIAQTGKKGLEARHGESLLDEAGMAGEGLIGKIQTTLRISHESQQALQMARAADPHWQGVQDPREISGALADIIAKLNASAVPGADPVGRVAMAVEAYQRVPQLDARARDAELALESSRQALAALHASRSWRITAPLRSGGDVLRRLKRRVEHSGPLGAGLVAIWNTMRQSGLKQTGTQRQECEQSAASAIPLARSTELLDLSSITPDSRRSHQRIAANAHIFYVDLLPEMLNALSRIPQPFDLFVSVTNEAAAKKCREELTRLNRAQLLEVQVVPNRGRDMGPFFVTFGRRLFEYDLVLHIHSKKSLYAGNAMNHWRGYLFDSLLGSEEKISKIFSLFESDPNIGVAYPQNFSQLPYFANTWLANRHTGEQWCARLGIPLPNGQYFDFPAGSMFWARPGALAVLLLRDWSLDDFPPEEGQNDGTTAHVLERLLVQCGRSDGYRPAILQDKERMNWSPWRIDAYFAQTLETRENALMNTDLRLIVMDVFDTLLTRPLLDPEAVKQIVSRRVDSRLGILYLEHRHRMEQLARERLGRDVNLAEIMAEFVYRSQVSVEQAELLRKTEEAVELVSVQPRPDVVEWFQAAVASGRKVVLASDMFLPRSTIEQMLSQYAIAGWSGIYVSNEIQARKDTGALYDLLLQENDVKESEILVVGDNERSDVQIPLDRGIHTAHVMRPVDMAAALPRWRGLLWADQARELDWQLTLGLIVRRFFGKAFHGDNPPKEDDFTLLGAYGVGFAVVGPMLAAFGMWLQEQAQCDGRTRLLFLAREGELLKLAFDRLASGLSWQTRTEYVELSRRCVTVAGIETEADVRKIANAADFFANDLQGFLQARYGLKLSPDDFDDLERRGIWSRGQQVNFHGNATHLEKVLNDLTPRIIAHARQERVGLEAYLRSLQIDSHRDALVDVGYSGTIQDALSALIRQAVPGYYMMTRDRIAAVTQRHSSFAKACFGDLLAPDHKSPSYWVHSFEVEQLLSSDEAQVVNYALDPSGEIRVRRQPLSEQELAARPTRTEVRRGALDFIDAVIDVRKTLLPDFAVPADCAEALFGAWIERPSLAEREALRHLVLDDHYCGRGIVEPLRDKASDQGAGRGASAVSATA